MKFETTGSIARKLGIDRDVVNYALRKGRVNPIGRAGIVRLFEPGAVGVVRKMIASKRQRKVADTILDQQPPIIA